MSDELEAEEKPQPLTKAERYQRWLGFFRAAAALPTSERVMRSVRRAHQIRRCSPRFVPVEKPKPTGPRPQKPPAVIKKLAKHRRYHGYPVWPGYTPAREVA